MLNLKFLLAPPNIPVRIIHSQVRALFQVISHIIFLSYFLKSARLYRTYTYEVKVPSAETTTVLEQLIYFLNFRQAHVFDDDLI